MPCEWLEPRWMLLGTYTSMAGTAMTIDTLSSGADTVAVSLSGGNTLTVAVNGVVDFTLASANSPAVLSSINIVTNGGNDKVDLNTTTKQILTPTTIGGGNGADTLIGGGGPDNIFGGAGNDSIDGALGNDTISGGLDNDTISYALRSSTNGVNVTLDNAANDGGAGETDSVGNANDVESIMGGAGNDVLVGNSLGNYISGGAGIDNIDGGSGNDTIVGGAGVDSLQGGFGADALFARDGLLEIVDGGPDIDAADTDPGESPPLPSAPLLTLSNRSLNLRSSFSTRRVARRNPQSAAASSIVQIPTKPVNLENVEGPIDASNIDLILSQLDPYTRGQAAVTRDNAGTVQIGGTGSADEFIIAVPAAGAPFLDILNNGGLTQFDLSTPLLQVQAGDGTDSLTVLGSGQGSTGSFSADHSIPNAGAFTANGRQITYNAVLPPTLAAGNFGAFTYVTPGGSDQVTINAGQPDEPIHIQGASDSVALPSFALSNIATLTLNTGQNDIPGASNDEVIVNATATGTNALRLALVLGTLGVDNVQINGEVILTNNPGQGAATSTVNVMLSTSTSHLTLEAPLTQLGGLALLNGSTGTIASGGNNVVVTRNITVSGASRFDVGNNTLIVDHAAANTNGTNLVFGMIRNAYQPAAAQHWLGSGITSTFASNDPSTGVGYASSLELFGAAGGGTFRGVSVDDTATIVTFTLLGDATLDRQVNFADLVNMAQNYNTTGASWYRGDFSFDNAVNFADLVNLAQNYNTGFT